MQVRKLAGSLDRFGFVLPILIDKEQRVVAGWGLVLAARQMGLTEVPAVSLEDLPELCEHLLAEVRRRYTLPVRRVSRAGDRWPCRARCPRAARCCRRSTPSVG